MRGSRAGRKEVYGLGSMKGHREYTELSPLVRAQVLSLCCSQGSPPLITVPSPGAAGGAGGLVHPSRLQEGTS